MARTKYRRYIRLTELIPELLDMVDENKIAFRPAVELSYLTETEQHNLLNSISYNDATPSLPQAIRLKEFSKAGKLSAEVIEAILGEEKPNQKEKISFKAERMRPYIPSTVPLEKTEDYIIKALEYYQRVQGAARKENKQDNRNHGGSAPICVITCPFLLPPLTLSPLVNHLYYYLRSKYRGCKIAKEVVAM